MCNIGYSCMPSDGFLTIPLSFILCSCMVQSLENGWLRYQPFKKKRCSEMLSY
jgi:hypothetical protein